MTETLSTENGRTILRMRRELRHPVERVWRAITEPEQLAGWFPAAVELDLRLDGPIRFTFEEDPGAPVDEESSGVIRACEPPRLLEYTWGTEVLRWELVPTADGCTLHLTATHDDRPGSASFTSGWLLCFDALEKVVGGSAVPAKDYAVLHEHFVKVYGLDEGVVLADGAIRFERQLVRPKELVWQLLAGAATATAGALPPAGFVAKGIEAGPVTDVAEAERLTYTWTDGEVSWTLRDGNGGARVVLAQTGPAAGYLDAWHDLVEALAAELVTRDVPS
ncbi:SRPBCC family protein [Kribbella turkmenica]|uniref:SRPBCC family protein n=1 Tax=Kribbella turkmenica TaxID=2530375 RepID=A0A4R4XFR5_9ACTN|nr:SRPBCC family protein [Kribbella turkmenica]TDD29560.1 SRPBCC family protein [Kribbella turkmenica]